MNLVWLAVDSLPRGGTVTIEAAASDGGARLKIVSAGPKVRLEDAYVTAMSGARASRWARTGPCSPPSSPRWRAKRPDARVMFYSARPTFH